ncbi:ABC transporter permease [Paenibacillus sp. AR247]|uniref:ABC transporter permease n=1 Tax=Paenibacillus sp. AR247 TaxID=1631599 RepID=UPI0015E2B702|nr:ABC transporter permease [Paenibacillus sp. AR247]
MKNTYLWTLWILLIVFSAASLFIGVKDISPLDLFHLTAEQKQVLWISRLPRLISIIIAGTSMSIIGLIMQQLTRNKFVSPTTAGTMDSARFGILVALMVFGNAAPLVKMLVAFVFALLGTMIFMRILDKVKYKDAIFIPLVGLMFGNIVSSVTTFFAYKNDLIQNMSSWLQGDFSMILKGRYEMLYISIPLLIIAYLFANRFTIAGSGGRVRGEPWGLTIRPSSTSDWSAISSVVILTVGMIPFLGLVVPNIVTMYLGDHLKKSLLHTALLGAVFVLFCDILGRVIIFPYEISIGVTVGVIGSAIFIFLLLRRRAYT